MKFVAIDPGTRKTGYCVMEWKDRRLRPVAMGTFSVRSKKIQRRLRELQVALEKLFGKHRPAHVAVERSFVGKNASSSLRLAEGRGVVLAAAGRAKAEVFEYAPAEVKRAVTANGNAAKSAVQRSIQLLFDLERPPEPDTADAAAVAICHAASQLGW